MATRAGVSQRVFHEVFPSVEECYRAAYEEGLGRLSRAVDGAATRERGWLERVRSGLVALLGFFDDEPSWGRLLVLETPVDAALARECRGRLRDVLTRLFDEGGEAGVSAGSRMPLPALTGELSALTGELVAGGVFSVIRTNLLEGDAGKLVELAPSLMAFIVAPYLGQAAAQAELEGRPSGRSEASATESRLARAQAISRAAELPIRATRRTTLVLRSIAQTPYSNNREIARAAGIVDEGQTSKLLARLERKGVIENVGVGAARGEPNAWLLTAEGRRAVELLGDGFAEGAERHPGRRLRGAL